MSHETFLHLALAQAELARGQCAPNPSVGAVAVYKNQVVAQGYHQGPGTAHAEQVVLSQLHAVPLEEVTLYITLEPCNHWGRTPPCVDALIQAGIKRVVYGFVDCNPIVMKGNTPALLREHGIEVIYLPLPEISQLYESYAYWMRHQRPWVSVKLALSLDGKIAGTSGRQIWLSNERCAHFTHEHRQKADWILTSAQTILHDDPRLTARQGKKERGKKLAILDSQLRLPAHARVFQHAQHILIFHDENKEVIKPHPQCQYVPTPTVQDKLNLTFILDYLGQSGHEVWVEAGGELFTAFHLAGLVQRTFLYLTPHVLGEDAVDAYRDKTVFQRQHSVSWRVLEDNVLLTFDWSQR